MRRLADRLEAGRELAVALSRYNHHEEAIILALPRGGVPVGFALAEALDLPLDVFVVRKLGVPGQEELAMGAIASGGLKVRNESVLRWTGVPELVFEEVAAREAEEIRRREREYRDNRPMSQIERRIVILVDDGLATGATMTAGLQTLRLKNPSRLIAAVPVGSSESCRQIARFADEVVCLHQPEPFYSVGQWYVDFNPVSDTEVRRLLSHRVPSGAGHHA